MSTRVDNNKMIQYIRETEHYALQILDKREELCKDFVEMFTSKKRSHVILTASGTSYNSCLSSKHFFEKVLKMPVMLYTAYDFAFFKTVYDENDFVITVTQEGESTNTIDAIKVANEHGMDNVVVTEDVNNTCTQLAKGKVTLDCEREYFGPKTKGYTCSVLTLYMMALEAAHAIKSISYDEYNKYVEACRKTIKNVPSVIDEAEKYITDNLQELIECDHAFVVGYGPHVGTALEGALKCLETVRDFYFSFETEEFLHGPLASVKPNVYTFIIAAKTHGYQRSVDLYDSIYSQNSHCYLIGSYDGENSDHVIAKNFVDDEDMAVFEYIVPLQLLAYYTFTGKGRDLNYRNYPRTSAVIPTKAKALERK